MIDHSVARRSGIMACVAVVAALSVSLTAAPANGAPASSSPTDASALEGKCRHPTVPDWFHDSLVTAIDISRDLDPSWADSPYIARIVCWQGSDFDVGFAPPGDDDHAFHGMFAMTVEEMEMVMGPWRISDRDAFRLTAKCFVYGWSKCSRQQENTRITQQEIAGLRWIWYLYGTPETAWKNVTSSGRFASFPRRGTDNRSTKTPFFVCPVDGTISYRDDFGDPRYQGGYHPHLGNDIFAPTGRPIRAPFSGRAVKGVDDWFAGKWVNLIGPKGYVHNGHLDAWGALGMVKKGTIIGYVGETGDAEAPQNHIEWHPWIVPSPLHEAPSGFSRIMDGIDPFPFLNQVC
jgi:hypothetical protein